MITDFNAMVVVNQCNGWTCFSRVASFSVFQLWVLFS